MVCLIALEVAETLFRQVVVFAAGHQVLDALFSYEVISIVVPVYNRFYEDEVLGAGIICAAIIECNGCSKSCCYQGCAVKFDVELEVI